MQGVTMLSSLANIKLNITEAACNRIIECKPIGTTVARQTFGIHVLQLTPVGDTCMHL